MPKLRTIIFYKEYFSEFFVKQRPKVKEKIIWTFDLIEEIQQIPERYLKHIENTDALFEIRVQVGSDNYRIFCFFDKVEKRNIYRLVKTCRTSRIPKLCNVFCTFLKMSNFFTILA